MGPRKYRSAKKTKKKAYTLSLAKNKPQVVIQGEPNENDIVMGRGNKIGQFPGNENFRRVCWSHKARYILAYRDEKQDVAREVLECISSLDPPGRVLEMIGQGRFVVVDEARAVEKTCQLLREKNAKCPTGMSPLSLKKVPKSKASRSTSRTQPENSKKVQYNEDMEEDDIFAGVAMKKAIRNYNKKSKKKKTPPKQSVYQKTHSTAMTLAKVYSSKSNEKTAKKAASKKTVKKVVIEKTPIKTPLVKFSGKTYLGKSPRRSLRIIISQSSLEARAASKPTNEEEQSFNELEYVESHGSTLSMEIDPCAIQSATQTQVSNKGAVNKVPLNPITPDTTRTLQHLQFSFPQVEAFPDAPYQLPDLDSTEDSKVTPTLLPDDFLRGLSGYSFRDSLEMDYDSSAAVMHPGATAQPWGLEPTYQENATVTDNDDGFEKELDRITAPPLTNFASRDISSWSMSQGPFATMFEPKARGSPQGVVELSLVPPPTSLKFCNSLFVDGMEAANAPASAAVFDNDSNYRGAKRTLKYN